MSLFLKNLLFTVLVPGSVGLWIPLWTASGNGATLALPGSPAQGAALIPVIAGFSLYLWCAWDFGVRGRGTPAPIDAPKVLVVQGLYRYLRNPMYVGVGLMIAGWSLYFRSSALLKVRRWIPGRPFSERPPAA